jgi:K+-transporting ATPase KdpF subunit
MLMNILLLGASRGGQMAGDIVLILICVLMCAYLFAALLWPEKF